MESDLQLAKMVKICKKKKTKRKKKQCEGQLEAVFANIAFRCNIIFQGNLVRQQVFVIHIFPFRVPVTIEVKTF